MAKTIEQSQAPGAVMDTQTEVAVMQQEPENKISFEVRNSSARALPENKGLLFELSIKINGDSQNEYDANGQARGEITTSNEFKSFMNLKSVCEDRLLKHDQARQRSREIEEQIRELQSTGDETTLEKISQLVSANVAVGREATIAWDEFTVTKQALKSARDNLVKRSEEIASATRHRIISSIKKDKKQLEEDLSHVAGELLLKLARCNHAYYRNTVGTLDSKMILQSYGVRTDPREEVFCTRGTGGVQPPPSNGGVGGIIGTTMVYRV